MLPHAAGDLADRLIDAFIHVVGFTGGVDDNMVRTKEDDFGLVAPVAFDIENGFGFDDFGVIKVQSLDFAFSIFAKRISDFLVTNGHDDIGVIIHGLHKLMGNFFPNINY